MDTPSETQEAATLRLRQLWGREPGKYWDEMRKANLTTVEVSPEHAAAAHRAQSSPDKSKQTKKDRR